jgi:hypothetical protein
MFEPGQNPGYEALSGDAARTIAEWTRNDWYETSTEDKPLLKEAGE